MSEDSMTTPMYDLPYPPFRLLGKSYPETIHQDWPRFYEEFPEVYDEFVYYQDHDHAILRTIRHLASFKDAVVLDVGSGTGKHAFPIACEASRVYALEPCAAMAARARQRARLVPKIAERITFLDSDAANVPLPDETVNIALASHSLTAIHARDVPRAKGLDDEDVRLRYEAKQEAMTEILRTLKPGGWLFSVSASPGALGGELTDVVLDDKVETWNSGKRQFLEWMRKGYRFQSVSVEADWVFPSPTIAARSYGFIFGPDAIGAILKQHITRVRNPVVLQYLRKP